MRTPEDRELSVADFVPVWSDVERQTVVDGDLLPRRDPPGSSEGADEAEPGVIYPGPDTAGGEAVVSLVSQAGAVVPRLLGRPGDVDITGRAQVHSNNNTGSQSGSDLFF